MSHGCSQQRMTKIVITSSSFPLSPLTRILWTKKQMLDSRGNLSSLPLSFSSQKNVIELPSRFYQFSGTIRKTMYRELVCWSHVRDDFNQRHIKNEMYLTCNTNATYSDILFEVMIVLVHVFGLDYIVTRCRRCECVFPGTVLVWILNERIFFTYLDLDIHQQ